MVRTFNIIVEQGEDGYLISEVVGLPGCHTQAKTLDQLMDRTREAIRLYIRTTVIPNHGGEDIDRGLLNKIVKQDIKIEREEFLKMV